MPTEKSAGAVVYRIEKDRIKYLLLYKKKHLQYNESWDFPKGGVEEDSEIDTVKREVKENEPFAKLKAKAIYYSIGLELYNFVKNNPITSNSTANINRTRGK